MLLVNAYLFVNYIANYVFTAQDWVSINQYKYFEGRDQSIAQPWS